MNYFTHPLVLMMHENNRLFYMDIVLKDFYIGNFVREDDWEHWDGETITRWLALGVSGNDSDKRRVIRILNRQFRDWEDAFDEWAVDQGY